MEEKLRSAFTARCPDWEIVGPCSKEIWFDRLQESCGVTGTWNEETQEPVEFVLRDLSYDEDVGKFEPITLATLCAWVKRIGFARFPNEEHISQLMPLTAEFPDSKIELVTIRVRLWSCWATESSCIRVTVPDLEGNSIIDVRPVDFSWEFHRDDTSGSMW